MNELDALNKIAETNGEKLKFINKRANILQKNIKRLKILIPLYEQEIGSAKDSSHIINRAIEYFCKSDEVKKRLEEV